MKKLIFSFVLFVGVLALVMNGCKGPEGPAGPAGADGTNGTDGTNGVDGNEVCLTCHTLANKTLVTTMYNLSGHAAGLYVGYAGGRKGCAICHSDQGFVETQYTGADTTAFDIANPQPIQCGTCHDFHATFDFDGDGPDFALRTNSPVEMIFDGSTVDFGGSGNLCANCHQTRRAGPVPGSGDFTITSTHWGPHHGPQANLLDGIGFFEVVGSMTYPTSKSTHRTGADCTTCHMHFDAADETEGGHTWWPSVASCIPCHPGATDFDINGVQTEIEGLLDDIKTEMIAIGLYDDAAGHVVTGTYTAEQAGAYFNWIGIEEDRSAGVHNYPYIKALLTNTLESF